MKKILFLFLIFPALAYSQVAKHNGGLSYSTGDTRYVNVTGNESMAGNLLIGGTLGVTGLVTGTAGFKSGTTAGATVGACGATQSLGAINVIGGLVTAGTCVNISTENATLPSLDGPNTWTGANAFMTSNVGIGTTSPASALVVIGTFTATAIADVNSCPTGMAYIPGPYPYCVDKYEAYLAAGTVTDCTCTNGSQDEVDACNSTAVAGSATGQAPLVSINWCAAKKACQLAGKHLLTNSEWFNAANYKGSKWNITAEQTGETMNCNTDSSAVVPTGTSTACVTQELVYDMIGNVWEWVDMVMTADPTNGLGNNYVTGYDFATGLPTSVGSTSGAYGNDYYWAYNGAGSAKVALRSGSWDIGAQAGVFVFHAADAPSFVNVHIGFRCGRRK